MVVLASSISSSSSGVRMASQQMVTHLHQQQQQQQQQKHNGGGRSSSSSSMSIQCRHSHSATRSLTTSAVAADTNLSTPSSSSSSSLQDQESQKYYFVVANAKFMLDQEEHFKELMFERLRLFAERNMEQDFWLVVEPKFLDKFPNITKRLKRPAVALVSTNRPWITYMKLRLDRVLSESYKADSLEEALASTPVKLDFGKPDNWVAPYQKYEYGWWETFLPPASHEPQA